VYGLARPNHLYAMIRENRQFVTNEPVEVRDCRKVTDHFREIDRIYSNLIMENRRMPTCNRLDLQTLGSQPIMPKNLPDHCLCASFQNSWSSLSNYALSNLEPTLSDVTTNSEGHFTHKPRAVTMRLEVPKRKRRKADPIHLQNHVVWSQVLERSVKSYVTGLSIKCYFNECLFMNSCEHSECYGHLVLC
jgi:hypothetical protein